MALYNKYFGYSMQQEDDYHGEYDDEAYGALYIPHVDEQFASDKALFKQVFAEQKIGTVTNVTFTELVAPSTYKGKNKKKAFSAQVYIKWSKNIRADALQEAIVAGNKQNARLQVDKKAHWVLHYNTVCSDALYDERCCLAELEETAMDATWRVLEETDEDLVLEDLEDLAKEVAMSVF